MVDPITLELIGESLISIVREMRTAVIRTAYSAMIHEGHDFSCAVLTAAGELVATSEVDQPTHLSALPWSARTVLAKYRDDIAPGDLFLHNDPYTGGTHLNDVALIHPVFVAGRRLALLGVMAHWQDIGGMVPGSLSGMATEIFQEGVRIPAIRIGRRGELQGEALDLLFANVRAPDDRRGDLEAMAGAARIADGKLTALVARWGAETVADAVAALLDRAEARMREAIRRIPDGDYVTEAYLDHAGTSPEPLLLKVRLTIQGDRLHADFTGCPPQVRGPTNIGPAHAPTAVYTMVKAFLDPKGPINAGAMRPISVHAPAETIVNARPPAACGAIGEVRRALESLVMGAIGKAAPERLVGDLKGASNITTVSGTHPRRSGGYTFTEFPAGGTGASASFDGNNAVRNFAEGDLSSIQPVEAIELIYPLRVERCVLRQDSGGDGARRGGLGLKREIRVLAHASLSVLSDKNVIPPYGVRGGLSGAPNRFTVNRGGREIEPSDLPGKVTGFGLVADDIVVVRTAGGGGWGDPLARDPALVLRDVRFGYISVKKARTVYGVVPAADGVDARATDALRRRLRARRHWLRALPLEGPEHRGMRRRAAFAPVAARRLRVGAGAPVEFPSPGGPSLRAWAEIDPHLPEDSFALGSNGLAFLGVQWEERVEVRRLALADV
ncbi:MAG: hydantoinase B/oxoprolinase family protein [Pseudomonadota bacterium]